MFIHDGDSIKDPQIASLSGAYSNPPGDFNSTGRYMLVRFLTDNTYTASGFSAKYTSMGRLVVFTFTNVTSDNQCSIKS